MSDLRQLTPVDIVLGHNFVVALRLTKPSQVVGDRFKPLPDSGRTVTAFLSLSRGEDATAIHADVSISVPELGTSADYYAEIPGANLTARLQAQKDTTTPVYLIAHDGTTIRETVECRVKSWQSMAVQG